MSKKREFEKHEYMYGPHFNEPCARRAVANMLNEDGTIGAHWSLDETTALANQYNIDLHASFNKYDWFVALNMIRSDFYKVITSLTNSDNVKHFIEFAKAWLKDKDITEGKMWHYYRYIMCDDEDDESYDDSRRYTSPRNRRYDDDEYEYRGRDYDYRQRYEPVYDRRSRY